MKLDLQLRDLQTGNRMTQSFANASEAKAWLEKRPRFTEVLGVASHNVPHELSMQLKAANRPLDQEEQDRRQDLEDAAEEEARKLAMERQKRAAAEARKHAEELAKADPNRPLTVHYSFTGEMRVGEPGDPREVTAAAREAVLAWVAERNEWVAGRGQIVGEANVQVWPGPIPEGQSERVVSGTFVPCAGPEKPN